MWDACFQDWHTYIRCSIAKWDLFTQWATLRLCFLLPCKTHFLCVVRNQLFSYHIWQNFFLKCDVWFGWNNDSKIQKPVCIAVAHSSLDGCFPRCISVHVWGFQIQTNLFWPQKYLYYGLCIGMEDGDLRLHLYLLMSDVFECVSWCFSCSQPNYIMCM